METPDGRKMSLIILVFLLAELSVLMVSRLKKFFGQICIYKQNVKMEPLCCNVGLRSLNSIWYNQSNIKGHHTVFGGRGVKQRVAWGVSLSSHTSRVYKNQELEN